MNEANFYDAQDDILSIVGICVNFRTPNVLLRSSMEGQRVGSHAEGFSVFQFEDE